MVSSIVTVAPEGDSVPITVDGSVPNPRRTVSSSSSPSLLVSIVNSSDVLWFLKISSLLDDRPSTT